MISVTISEPLAQAAIISTIRAAFPNILAIYLFGSRANGTANPESDLDLAVLVAGYVEPLQLWKVSNDLAEIAGCEVDLLDMRAASTVMQYQILQTGRRLWANKLEADLFECFVLNEKLYFDQSRAGLLADIQKRGTVYG
jgi:predicted nucleotidyltransferase